MEDENKNEMENNGEIQNNEDKEILKETNKENSKKDHTMVIMISIIAGLLLIVVIVVAILNAMSGKKTDGNNDTCSDGGTCPLGLFLPYINYLKSIL